MSAEYKWPFRPDHITNDGESFPEDNALRKLTGQGIIPNGYMQGEQTSICATLNYPTFIIEFSPTGEPVRTESALLAFNICSVCMRFREFAGAGYCKQSDSVHAKLFQGCTQNDLAGIESHTHNRRAQPALPANLE